MLTKIIVNVLKYLEHVVTVTKYSAISLKDFAKILSAFKKSIILREIESSSHGIFFCQSIGKMCLV